MVLRPFDVCPASVGELGESCSVDSSILCFGFTGLHKSRDYTSYLHHMRRSAEACSSPRLTMERTPYDERKRAACGLQEERGEEEASLMETLHQAAPEGKACWVVLSASVDGNNTLRQQPVLEYGAGGGGGRTTAPPGAERRWEILAAGYVYICYKWLHQLYLGRLSNKPCEDSLSRI